MGTTVFRHWIMVAFLMAVAALMADTACARDVISTDLTTACRSCHGETGDSALATVPRLNGQKSAYILSRLKTLIVPGGNGLHGSTTLWDATKQVDDTMLRAIANYYAGENPPLTHPVGPLVDKGRILYANGNLAERVPACQQCHGANAEGDRSIPRLAGQHGDYLRIQLERFRSQKRGPDFMHNITNNLTDFEIKELLSYLAND
jgi:cytochrome c553